MRKHFIRCYQIKNTHNHILHRLYCAQNEGIPVTPRTGNHVHDFVTIVFINTGIIHQFFISFGGTGDQNPDPRLKRPLLYH